MYALISVYDDTNKCIYKNNLLTPNMVNHDGEYTTYRFEFAITVAENQVPTMNGKFKHDDIPEPETNKLIDQEVENGRRAADDFVNKLDDISEGESEKAKAEADFLKRHNRMMENSMYGLSVNQCAICKKVIYDDKVICDRCFKIAKREGFLE